MQEKNKPSSNQPPASSGKEKANLASKPATDPLNLAAHDEALSDIEADPDLSMKSPNDDLDEGETARLGEDKTDLV